MGFRGMVIAALVALLGGAALLSIALGWKLGIGIALLVWFHKASERA